MARYTRGTVNNNWDRDQDVVLETTRPALIPSSDAALVARYHAFVAQGANAAAERTRELLNARGIDVVAQVAA